MANARRTNMPVEYVRTGRSRYPPSSENSPIEGASARASANVKPKNTQRKMDILPAGGFRVHSQPDVGEGRDLAVDNGLAGERRIDAGSHTQERGLACAIGPDETQPVAVDEIQRDVHERTHDDRIIMSGEAAAKPGEHRRPDRARVGRENGKGNSDVAQRDASHGT
jgi:hypothetical protein